MTQQAAATFGLYQNMPALKMLILYCKGDFSSKKASHSPLGNTLATSQNSKLVEQEMRLTAEKLSQLQDVRKQIQTEIESMEKSYHSFA